jgi:Spy/CpxP family protein refolding chaperone
MKKSTLTISILALVVLIAVPFLYAGPGRDHGMAGFGPLARLERAQQELGLSDQQVGQIKTIFKGLHEQNAAYRDQLRGGLQGVMNTLIKNPNDIAAAQALIDQQADAERAMKTNLLSAASKALNVLTPDQREKLGQMIAERASRWHHQQF